MEFILFIKQLGLAISGAASLWGLVFLIKGRRTKSQEEKKVFQGLAQKIITLLILGSMLAIIAWLILVLFGPTSLQAHEGIVIAPTPQSLNYAMGVSSPLFIWLAIILFGFIFFQIKKRSPRTLILLYILNLIAVSILISIPALTKQFNNSQLFFIGHGFHSILTLGTVIVLDFLFFLSKYKEKIKEFIYPLFPAISKVIWVGLGIEFLSAWLIFDKGFFVTPKFLFMQTVVAIIIINGALLSGPLTRKLISTVKGKREMINKKWDVLFVVGGSISISSWLTITFVDSFQKINLSYLQFLSAYLIFIILIYSMYSLMHTKIEKRFSKMFR